MDKKYANWSERRNLLIKLQGLLLQYFPKEDYNVIIFGSYIRADFDVGKSDIDIIVYAEDEKKQEKVGGFVKKFFQKEEISSDVLLYSFNPFGFIFLFGIMNGYKLTEYYPRTLKAELYQIHKCYERYLREKNEEKKYDRWKRILEKG